MFATTPIIAESTDFCYSCFDKQAGLTAICNILSGSRPMSPHAHHLDLSHNNLTNDDLTRIADALERNTEMSALAQLRSIDLSFNDLRGDDRLHRALSIFCVKLRSLKSLNLCHSGIGAAFFDYVIPHGVKLTMAADRTPSKFGEMIDESSSDEGSDEEESDQNAENEENEEAEIENDPFIAHLSDVDADYDGDSASDSDYEVPVLAPKYSNL